MSRTIRACAGAMASGDLGGQVVAEEVFESQANEQTIEDRQQSELVGVEVRPAARAVSPSGGVLGHGRGTGVAPVDVPVARARVVRGRRLVGERQPAGGDFSRHDRREPEIVKR